MHLIMVCFHNVLASIRAQMQYRVSFLIEFIFGLVFQSVGFAFASIVLTRFESVAGWTLWEVGLIFSVRLVAHGVWTVSVNQLYRFDQIIQNGEWDRYLVRPMPIWSQLMFTEMRVPAIGDLAAGILILSIVLNRLEIAWSVGLVLFLLLSILGGALIEGALQLGVAAFTFRHLETQPIRVLLDQVQGTFAGFPVTMYDRTLQVAITWVIPLAFISWVPSSVVLSRSEELPFPIWAAWASPIIGPIFFAFATALFAKQSRHYQSAGH